LRAPEWTRVFSDYRLADEPAINWRISSTVLS